jgi:gamma-resorcylate decarboxylase
VVENLNVPFYLHPRNPLSGTPASYDGHPWLIGPTWAFAAETAVHALRLIGSGLFDEFPRLAIILGHLGEGLPFYLWRIDNRNAWMKAAHKYGARKRVADYVRANFHLTTSGHFSTPALMDAISEVGVGRVMFSVDYPFEDISDAADWFDSVPLGDHRPHQCAAVVRPG